MLKYILPLFLLPFSLFPQDISVIPIRNLDQLPVNAIRRIFHDREGYVWYGTSNGLCRDDGYNVEVFRSDISSPSLLNNNLIECIAEDHQNKIWFGKMMVRYILAESRVSAC